jgi:Tol biopolymer transport system component
MGATTLAISVSETGGLAYSSVLSGPIANRQFVWIDRTGKQLGNVGPPASYFEFSLSPDDKRLAASRIDGANADIWVVDLLHDRGASRFTFTPRPDRSPLWSPDGSRISFSSGGALYEKPAGGGVERMISAAPGSLLDWSRDGRFLLYQDKDDLWILTDGKPAPLLKTEFRERLGQFAPDGNYVAYASDESKRNDVYVQSFPGSSGKWMISPAGGSQPRWRRDGKELFFVALDGRMMSVPVKTDSGFEPGAATALFEMPEFQQGLFAGAFAYAVSGDGQRFLILRSAEPANLRPVTVMTNWLAGVKK